MNATAGGSGAPARGSPAVEQVDVSAYTVPTDAPEADGTWAWDKTTLVLVEVTATAVAFAATCRTKCSSHECR